MSQTHSDQSYTKCAECGAAADQVAQGRHFNWCSQQAESQRDRSDGGVYYVRIVGDPDQMIATDILDLITSHYDVTVGLVDGPRVVEIGTPTEADLERGRQLADKYGW